MNFATPNQCYINAPFYQLEDGLLDFFIENGFQPEIGLEGDALYQRNSDDFIKIAKKLQRNGLSCTLHAPFFDLSPGALDQNILKVSRNKLRLAFGLIEIFKPSAIICHLGFEENKHGYKLDQWQKISMATWQELLQIAKAGKTRMLLENTYETDHTQHENILTSLHSEYSGFCLDVGHLMAFAKCSWQNWLPAMNPWLAHLHLHDNDGESDSHIGVGKGSFDFKALFNYLDKNNIKPLITLEPHTKDALWESVEALASMGIVQLGKTS